MAVPQRAPGYDDHRARNPRNATLRPDLSYAFMSDCATRVYIVPHRHMIVTIDETSAWHARTSRVLPGVAQYWPLQYPFDGQRARKDANHLLTNRRTKCHAILCNNNDPVIEMLLTQAKTVKPTLPR